MDRSTPTDGKSLGYGIDESPQTRPGVPRERLAGDPDAHWKHPEQQRGVELLSASGLRAATPVFGTAQPVRGLSGAVRRAAYRVPEQRTARWLLLVAADRIDVVEHRLARVLWLLPAAAALAVGYLAVSRALARR